MEFTTEPHVFAAGSGSMNSLTLTAAAATLRPSDGQHDHVVRLPISANIIDAKSQVIIGGDDSAYNGQRYIPSVAAGYIDIYSRFTAETPSTSDTVLFGLKGDGIREFTITSLIFRIIGTVPSTTENLTFTNNADRGSDWDENIITQAMSGVDTFKVTWDPGDWIFNPDDQLEFAWENTDTRTWSLKLGWGRRNHS